MASFSAASKARLITCHPDLQRLFNRVIERRDCTIISGRRGQKEQDELYRGGFSQKKYPFSRHNSKPSEAVDVLPYHDCTPHLRYDDLEGNLNFVGFVQGIADTMGIEIRSGGDWNQNLDFDDDSFFDIAHFELV